MGRRALRFNDEQLDLQSHLFTYEQLPDPWDAVTFFGREAPLVIEVGSGKGLFMVSTGAAHPEINLLGIEIAPQYARYCAARLARRGLSYAKMIGGPAEPLFHDKLASNSVQAVHVYFPDPWWKRRHRRRRVLQPAFLTHIERVLQPGGEFHFWTDVQEYYQVTLAAVADVTRLQGPLTITERPAAHDLDYQTNFERRTRQCGQPVYRCYFMKTV